MQAARVTMLLAALVAAPLTTHAQAKKVRIAILEIRPLATDVAKAELLSEVALTEAASISGFEIIGKSDINSIIGFEKQKQVIGCGDDSTCLAEIGGALGVDYILVGSLGTLGDLFRIDLKLVDSKKAKVRSRIGVTVDGKESKLVAAIQKAVHDLLSPVTPAGGSPVVASAAPAKFEGGAKAPAALEASPRSGALAPLGPASPIAGAGVSTSARTSRRTWAYATGGGGLALLLGGAIAGLQAKSAFQKEKSATNVADYDSNKSKAKSMSLIADVLFAGGAAGVGVGTWLFVTSRPGALALELAPVPGGGAVASISGGF